MSFKIVSYNILKGGKNGLEQLAQAVIGLEADCVGLLEANTWGEESEKLLNNFSESTQLPFSFFAKANTNYDIVCLGKTKPQTSVSFQNGFWHTALLNVFQTKEVGEVAIIFVHLNPKSETERVMEVQNLLNILKSYPHAIIMGDLNSLSPRDSYDQATLLKDFQNQHITKFGSDNILFDTIKTIEAAGLVDCAAYKNNFSFTVPTPANIDMAHSIPLRIDYAFVTANLLPFVENISIKTGGLFDKASDHFPLVLEMNLSVL